MHMYSEPSPNATWKTILCCNEGCQKQSISNLFQTFEKQKFDVMKYINTVKVHTRPKLSVLFSFYKTHDDCSILFSKFSQTKSKVQTNVVCVYGIMEFISNPCKCITQDM